MKTFFIFLLIFTASAGQAAQVLTCNDILRQGNGVVVVKLGQNQAIQILMKWHLNNSEADFSGAFDGQAQPYHQTYAFIGRGLLGGSPASIQGSMERTNGIVQLSVHTADRRFDLGYGLNLACR